MEDACSVHLNGEYMNVVEVGAIVLHNLAKLGDCMVSLEPHQMGLIWNINYDEGSFHKSQLLNKTREIST